MTVIALDFVPVNPYTTDTIMLGIGQRADILITAEADSTSSWWMRSEVLSAATCGGLAPPGTGNIPVLASIYYEDADTSSDPTSESTNHNPSCDNAPIDTTSPEFPITPSSTPYYQSMVLELITNATGSYEWTINGQTYRADYNNPILYDAEEGMTSFPDNPEYNVYNFANNGSVILNITNATPFPHPIHMHGHDFYVLSVSDSNAPPLTPWDASVVNPSNPMRRDTQIVPALGYIAIQFEANNPGTVSKPMGRGFGIRVVARGVLLDLPTLPQCLRHLLTLFPLFLVASSLSRGMASLWRLVLQCNVPA